MTPNKENIEAILCAYVDGDLDAAGRAEIEKHLAENPQHRQILAEMIAMRGWVKSLPRATAPSELADALTGQLERSVLLGEGPVMSRAMPSAVNRRSQWLAIAAVVLLTAGLGLAVWAILIPTSGRPRVAVAPLTPPDNSHGDIVLEHSDNGVEPPAPAGSGIAAMTPDQDRAPGADGHAVAPAGAAAGVEGSVAVVVPSPAAPSEPPPVLVPAPTTRNDLPEAVASGNAASPAASDFNRGTISPPALATAAKDLADQPPVAVRQRLAEAGVLDSADVSHRMVVLVNAADPSAASAQVAQVLTAQNIAYSNVAAPTGDNRLALNAATNPSQQLAMGNTIQGEVNGGLVMTRDGSFVPNRQLLASPSTVTSNFASAAEQAQAQAIGAGSSAATRSAGPTTVSSLFDRQFALDQQSGAGQSPDMANTLAGQAPAPGAGAAPMAPASNGADGNGQLAGAEVPAGGAVGGFGAGGGYGGLGGGGGAGGFAPAGGGGRGGRGGAAGGAGGASAGRGGRGGGARGAGRAASIPRRSDAAATTLPANPAGTLAHSADINGGVFVVRNLTAGQAHNLQASLANSGGLDLRVYGPSAAAHDMSTTRPLAGDVIANQQMRQGFIAQPATIPVASAGEAQTQPSELQNGQTMIGQLRVPDSQYPQQAVDSLRNPATNPAMANVPIEVAGGASQQPGPATQPSDTDGMLVLIVVQAVPTTQPAGDSVPTPAGQ